MVLSVENLPEYQFVVVDQNGNIVHGIKVNALKSEYEIDLINKIETGLKDSNNEISVHIESIKKRLFN